jgi:asparaginyl-tRNA synthetase
MIHKGEYVKQVLQKEPGTKVTVYGWVKTRREGKGVCFVQLQDGSCPTDLQVVLVPDQVPHEVLSAITTGSALRVDGQVVASPGAGQLIEVRGETIEVYGSADPATYPLQKKGHTMEFLREIAHLRPRSNTFSAVFRVRNALCYAIHRFFQDNGFMYVHSPVITTSDCEGAGAMFAVTTLDLAAPPKTPEGQVDFQKDFFAKPAFLTVSGQLEGEMFAHAFTNIYTFGPTFRAENSNTPRHLAEFWMIEPEMAFADLDDNREMAERFLKTIIAEVMDRCADDLEFFDKRIDNSVLQTLENVVNSDFVHLPYAEAIRIVEDASAKGKAWEFPVGWGHELQSEHERYITEEIFRRPVIVTDYPQETKAFYMRVNDDGRTVAAMDVLIPRIGEIIGGSQREERLDILRSRIQHSGLSDADYWWYLDLRRYGSVPHAGFGLGLERMMMYLTGMKNIRDVIPCPRTPGSALF